MVKVEIIVSKFTSNCYIVQVNDNTYVIDPSVSVDSIKKYLNGRELKGILITHGHMDHIFNLEEVESYFDCFIYISKYGKDMIFDNNHNYGHSLGVKKSINLDLDKLKIVNDNDIIDENIKVIYTPGHTKDSICFMIEDKLFTGDTLFNGNVGRSDLYSGNTYELVNSIKKIYSLNKDLYIYPGHDSSSTLNYQFMNNQFVRDVLLKVKD